MMTMENITNAKFAKEDKTFIKMCNNATVKATKRQASKFRMKKGIAWKVKNMGLAPLSHKMPGYSAKI